MHLNHLAVRSKNKKKKQKVTRLKGRQESPKCASSYEIEQHELRMRNNVKQKTKKKTPN